MKIKLEAFSEKEKLRDFRVLDNAPYLDVNFGVGEVFNGGRADFAKGKEETIQRLIRVIETDKKGLYVTVEGFTDDIPVKTNKWQFPTNWELSGARAARILRMFQEAGFNQKILKFSGYGQARPLLPNFDQSGAALPMNQMRNRRIAIRISQSAGE